MGFFIGALSGALVAGGCYYAYSSTMNQRTQRHVAELRALSHRLEEPTLRSIPPSASTHIPRQLSLSDQIKTKWNDGLLGLVTQVTRRGSGQ